MDIQEQDPVNWVVVKMGLNLDKAKAKTEVILLSIQYITKTTKSNWE